MTKTHLFILLMTTMFIFSSCSKDDENNPQNFDVEYSFELDGTKYDFDNFLVNKTWLEDQNRIFISKTEGDDLYNVNFPLDLQVGANGMNWFNGGVWFFFSNSLGDFYTLDEDRCTMNVITIDTTNRQISATFSGVGTQVNSTDEVTITNGVLRVEY